MSTLTINNLEKQLLLTLFNIDMQCIGKNQGGVDREICFGEVPINLYDYVSYEGQVFLQFEDVSVGRLVFELSIQGSQPEPIIQGAMYSCYKTDNIVFYTEYNKGYHINKSYHGVCNMKIYRDAVDQNENNGNPVLLNTVQIKINAI